MRALSLGAAALLAAWAGPVAADAPDLAPIVAALPALHAVIVERAGKRVFTDVPGASAEGEPRWRWASQTKQVIAVLVMQEVAAGRVDLDQPIGRYLPAFRAPNAGRITVRQLLRHQSGLPNPDDVAATPAAPSGFYSSAAKGTPLDYCAGPAKGEPGGNWSYNNCDYIVAGELLRAVTGRRWQQLVDERIARPLRLRTVSATGGDHVPRNALTIEGKPEEIALPDLSIARFGASAVLSGTPSDLVDFDRALVDNRLLDAKARAEMWDGQPKLGFMALGQWVFDARLKGCPAPVRIVERRGGIGGQQMHNFILPEKGVIAVVFVGNAEFDFGEIWQGKGFSFDLLSKAACA